jgi:pimeloyl-ACP methyl ester carboxylesterase
MRALGPLALRRELLFPFLALGANSILDNVFVSSPEENQYVRWFHDSALRDAEGMHNLWSFARVSESLCRDLLGRDYSDRFSHIHIPVLALWGDSDRLTYVPSVLRSLRGLPRLRTIVVKRCGHMPMVEYPAETLFHLERFLTSPPQ